MTSAVYLITGFAGFPGINLCGFPPAHGQTARSRDIAAFDNPERSAVQEIRGDSRDSHTASRAFAGANILVHCATAGYGTRTVPEALRDRVARCIESSSTVVYDISGHRPIHETDALSGVGPGAAA